MILPTNNRGARGMIATTGSVGGDEEDLRKLLLTVSDTGDAACSEGVRDCCTQCARKIRLADIHSRQRETTSETGLGCMSIWYSSSLSILHSICQGSVGLLEHAQNSLQISRSQISE
jgi:hypothetical protein